MEEGHSNNGLGINRFDAGIQTMQESIKPFCYFDTTMPSVTDIKLEHVEVLSNSDDTSKASSVVSGPPSPRRAEKRKESSEDDRVSKKHRESMLYEADDTLSDTEEYYLTVLDAPKDVLIKNYLDECGIVDEVETLSNDRRNVRLTFQNILDRERALNKIKDEGIKGQKLRVELGQSADLRDDRSDTTEVIPHSSSWRLEDAWDTDPLGLYGLKLELLKSLNITPPLDRWVHVSNFVCDKYELREVMELAGHVISCCVVNISRRYAKVQYSHPLEAVQAISMLNRQVYYGLSLQIYMERNPRNDVILPKGLMNIGLGLGMQGRPIRNIVKEYKKYIRHQDSLINTLFFRKNVSGDDSSKDEADLDKLEEINKEKLFKIKRIPSDDENGIFKICSNPDCKSVQFMDIVPNNRKPEKAIQTELNSPISLPQPDVPGNSNHLRIGSPFRSLPPLRSRSPVRGLPYAPNNSVMSTRPGTSQVPFSNRYPGPSQSETRSPSPIRMPTSMPNPIPTRMPTPMPIPMTTQISTPMPTRMPTQMPTQMPTRMPTQMPTQMPTPMPTRMSNPVPTPMPTSIPNPMTNQMLNQIPMPLPLPSLRPNQMPSPIPNQRPSQMPNEIPNQRPSQMPNQIPNQRPNHMPRQIPNPIRNQPRPGPFASHPFRAPFHGTIPGEPPPKTKVQFSNLPLSTTFPFLCERVSTHGQVLAVEFTTPGCALVTFGHPLHAEACIQNFNGMNVEGHTIVVTYV